MSKFKDIAVYGGGSWGTALACQVARCYENVSLFLRDQNVIDEIQICSTNSKYLGKIILPTNIKPTNKLDNILDKEVIIISTSSVAFNNIIHILKNANISKNIVLLIATKGLSNNPVELFSDKLKTILPNNPIAFISGPNFAKEVAQNLLTPVTIAAEDINLAKKLANSLVTNQFIISTINDIIAIQITGAVKNIIAIKSGLFDATGHGWNAKAGLIGSAMQEIMTLVQIFGGKLNDKSILFEPGILGDLVLTCYSHESRNTKFGYELGCKKNNDRDKFLNEYNYLVEGCESVQLVLNVIRKYNLSLPIIASVAKELQLL